MTERRERLLNERRERALDRALDLFKAEGFDAISMQDIADAAEISKGSLYLQFENKEAIAVALLERTFDKLEKIIEKETKSPGIAKERLTRIVKSYIETAREVDGRDFNLWLLSSLPSHPGAPYMKLMKDRIGRLTRLVSAFFAEGAEDGTIRPGIEPEKLIQLFSLISVLFMERISKVQAFTPIVETDDELMFQEFLDIILYYITPQGAAKA